MATTLAWRSLTLATGTDSPYRITAVDGWESLPPPRYNKMERVRAHGVHPTEVWADERTVTVEGFTFDPDRRDALLLELKRGLAYGAGEEPLTITLAGRTLTASAQLLRCDPVLTRDQWGVGWFGWVAQWRCTDPLRYGPVLTASTGLPVSGGGLTYPLAYPLDYGAAPTPATLTLANAGTADAPITFTVTGPLPGGFELTSAGQHITYAAPVPAGQTVSIDTGTGAVLVEGTADRRSELVAADWIQIPAGQTIAVAFTSLGGYNPAATAVATWRAAHW